MQMLSSPQSFWMWTYNALMMIWIMTIWMIFMMILIPIPIIFMMVHLILGGDSRRICPTKDRGKLHRGRREAVN